VSVRCRFLDSAHSDIRISLRAFNFNAARAVWFVLERAMNCKKKFRSLIPMAQLMLLTATAVAVSPVSSDTATTTDDVVVTATRTTHTADSALASVQVINRQQIENAQANDVAELLRFNAGVEIARNGGPGQAASVFIRGAESNHTLLLIDGVKVNTGTEGGAAWQNINPAMIERIEIVRGPRSSLYGSEAIGGVVQIFTRKPGQALSQQVALGVGSNNSFKSDARISAVQSGTRFGAGLSFYGTDGYQTRTTESLDRGHNNYSLDLNLGRDLGFADLDFSSWWSRGKTEYFADTNFDFILDPVDQDFQNGVSALTIDAAPAENWGSTLKLSYNLDEIKQNQSDDLARTKRWAGDWQNDVQIGEVHLLTVGAYLAKEETDAISFGAGFHDKDKNVKAAFAQDQIALGAHNVLVAARYTDDGQFGDKTTWNLGYGYSLTHQTSFYASVATGFKAPTFLDLFGFGGNPDLDPETSKSYEVGLTHQVKPGNTLEVSVFQNDIDDLINFFEPDGSFANGVQGQQENIDESRTRGVELRYGYSLAAWSGNISAVYQDPEDRDTKDQLPRRAKKSLTASANYKVGKYRLGGQFLASGERPDFAGSPRVLEGYGVLDLNADIRVSRNLVVQGRLENVFDKDYETAGTFKAQGRAYFVNLRLSGD
jgi:vitamin B12 transporter